MSYESAGENCHFCQKKFLASAWVSPKWMGDTNMIIIDLTGSHVCPNYNRLSAYLIPLHFEGKETKGKGSSTVVIMVRHCLLGRCLWCSSEISVNRDCSHHSGWQELWLWITTRLRSQRTSLAGMYCLCGLTGLRSLEGILCIEWVR